MFKLFRDSIFSPRKIIFYRAKPAWFTLLYVLILFIITFFALNLKTITSNKINYGERLRIVQVFRNTDAKITDYSYVSNKSYMIDTGEFSLVLSPSEYLAEIAISNYAPDYIVVGNNVYLVFYYSLSYSLIKLGTLNSYLSEGNLNLYELNEDNEVFTGLNKITNGNKVIYMFTNGLLEASLNIIGTIIVSLIAYLFLIGFYRAHAFMRKGQLFKMLIYGSTLYLLVRDIQSLFGFGGFLGFVLFALSLIPLFTLEKEITRRIIFYQISKGIIKDEELIEKFRRISERENKKENKDDED